MTTPVINCVSLRELQLDGVRISEEALHAILSSCSLLVKIKLFSCKGFKTIKVKNLHCLYELRIFVGGRYQQSTAFEISDVPNLSGFSCNLHFPFKSDSISLRSNVTQLMLDGSVITDNACLYKIKSGFPFLESLTLGDMSSWKLESFHFTCASIERLTLKLCPYTLIDIRVNAPKLLIFCFDGVALPNLLFPVSTLKPIEVSLRLDLPVDAYVFLKMKESLTLSEKCYVRITTFNSELPLDIDIDHLRTRLLSPPATNVQELWFETNGD
ncbi:unnamed protein product [Lactuca virosa]|uniref:At1g61320/AtMIF1 LRR domain-containing protein n=1 Tax=Lactuca virosa TaxID=75947 RepID=A0AAU9MIM9_9ASTR|nr:unnamed protein product [Lactuca virosa]